MRDDEGEKGKGKGRERELKSQGVNGRR